jgi:hypothetical protein
VTDAAKKGRRASCIEKAARALLRAALIDGCFSGYAARYTPIDEQRKGFVPARKKGHTRNGRSREQFRARKCLLLGASRTWDDVQLKSAKRWIVEKWFGGDDRKF